MAHMKRYMMPKGWKVHRKAKTYVVTPSPGPHPKMASIPLLVVVRDILGYAESGDEARSIIKHGAVLVDGVVRKEHNYPAGFMDAVTMKTTGENFRITKGHGGLYLEKTTAADAGKKLCIIRKKYTAKGNVQCLSLHDGRVIRLGKDAQAYSPGDTLVIDVPGQKITGHFRVEKGAEAVITGGKNTGARGRVKEVRDRKFMTEKSIVVMESGGREIETIRGYVMATGREARK